MSALGGFHCRSCNMAFRSPGLLETHRQRFCIGSEIGDPFVLNRGRAEGPWREAGPKRTNTPDFIKLRERGSEPQKARQWEERAGDRDGEIRGSLSDSLALRKLTDEFHKLRLSLEESLPSVPGWVQAEESRVPPREWEYNTRVREVSETHEQHLADIQARNLELEGQREEIRRRLSQLSAKDSGTAHIEAMLLELRAQEERNEWALQQLSEQIQALHGQQGTAAAPVQPGPPSPAPPEVRKDLSVSFEMLSFGDGPLSSQIRALRLAYMQAGGSDPVILAQMHDLQAEAHTLERTGPRAEHRGKKKKKAEPPPRALDSELQAVERENQRLEEDILRLQLQRERQRGEEEAVGLQEMQRDHVRQMAAVQTEIESLRRDLERGRDPPRGRAPPPPVPPPPPLPPPLPHYPPGGLGQPLPPPATERVQPPIGQHLLEPPEALSPAPYDPVAGFVLFYDFVLGLEPTLSMVRLVVGLYSGGQEMGRPTPLPAVYCEVGGGLPYVTTGHPGNIATLSVKQPVPRVHPSPSICLVVELQAAGGFDSYGQEVQRLVSRGWARLDLFDQHNRVQSGWWKVPFRTLPVRPALSTGQLNAVPQVGRAELYLRVVNARDGDMQSLANTDPGTASQYKYPAMVATRPVVHLENPAPRHAAFQPPANRYLSLLPPTDHVDPPPPMEGSNQSGPAPTGEGVAGVGIIVDRVRGAPLGDGSLRLTGYSQRTGKVIECGLAGMLCYTSTVSSCIKHGEFAFGEQQIFFPGVQPQKDQVLILRFYHWPSSSPSAATCPWEQAGVPGSLAEREECAAAWGLLRLTRPPALGQTESPAGRQWTWNTGTHSVVLYHAPAPPAAALTALSAEQQVTPFEPYGDASARMHVYSGERPAFPFPPDSPIDTSIPTDWPQAAYILCRRESPPARPFLAGDGTDLYIDGARFLPDCVTVSRVTGRIFDRHYNQVGPDISTGIDLDSNIFEPVYGERVEIRCPCLPPSATLLLKLYAVDRFSRRLVLIGWAALGLFVESGSETQPSLDTGGLQVSLNEGAHQLRLYHSGPDPNKPLSCGALSTGGRCVPCASLLVRLLRAPVDESGRALSQGAVAQADWEPVGLFCPRPSYSEGGYFSESAKPSQGEACLHMAMSNRSVVLVREIVAQLAGSQGAEPSSDAEILDWIKQNTSRMMDSKPQPFNLSLVSRYLSCFGVKVSVDGGLNLPWSSFTLALCAFSPPAAFYHGASAVKYDRPAIFQELDFSSSHSAPRWLDGFKSFPRRMHHPYLAVIVHLHAMSVLTSRETQATKSQGLTYSLEGQAWAAVPIFTRGYCHTARYQLPLYQGAPSEAALSMLSQGPCHSVLENLRQKGQVQLLRGASVFVRIADGRRDGELDSCGDQVELDRDWSDTAVDTDLSQLPLDQRDSYSPQPTTAPLSQLIPTGRPRDEFVRQLSVRFTQLIKTLKDTPEHRAPILLQPPTHPPLDPSSLPPQPSAALLHSASPAARPPSATQAQMGAPSQPPKPKLPSSL